MTPERKIHIDGLSIFSLLQHWRFAPPGDKWMQGETGEYWALRMKELRTNDSNSYIQASKNIGWGT